MTNQKQTFKSGIWQGWRDGLPFALVVAPFGLLFGIVGTEAGLNIYEVMAMTVLVIAGASQFTAVALWESNAPTIVVLLTSLAVNLRMAMYSAALVPHFRGAPMKLRILAGYAMVDQNFALMDTKFADDTTSSWETRISYFFGVFLCLSPLWYAFTFIGAVFGTAIPPEYAIDFALPIAFLSLIGPMIRSLPHAICAFSSVVFALSLAWVPYGLGLLLAALISICIASMAEVALERRLK